MVAPNVTARLSKTADPVDTMLRGRYAQGSFLGYVYRSLTGRR